MSLTFRSLPTLTRLQRYGWVLLGLAGLRLIFWWGAFPNPDEAYYWLWGQHLSPSYFDHPPFQAWVQGLFTAALGRSHGGLRLPNLISNGLLLALYWRICHALYGQSPAGQRRRGTDGFWLTVILLFTSPLFFYFLAIAWPDHWLVLFGVAAGYCLSRFLAPYARLGWGDGRWLYASGVFLGLAGLCKYLALLLGLSFLGAIAVHRRWRRLYRDGRLYGAAAIALLLLTPVFVWNAQHQWASFSFYLGRSGAAGGQSLQGFAPLGFLLLCGLSLGPIQAWAAGKGLRQLAQSDFERTYRRLAIAAVLGSTASLALVSLWAPVLYYWNILAYPLLFPLMAGVFLPRPGAEQPLHYGGPFRAAVALGLVVVPLLVVHFTVLPLSALVSHEGDPDTRMVYGWPQIATAVRAEAAQWESPPRLFTTDYRSAAALAYQLNDPTVMAISGRRDQFDFWYDRAALAGRDALLLGDAWHPICPAHRALFDRTETLQSLGVQRFGIDIKRYTLMQGHRFEAGPSDRYPRSPDYPLAFTADGETCQ